MARQTAEGSSCMHLCMYFLGLLLDQHYDSQLIYSKGEELLHMRGSSSFPLTAVFVVAQLIISHSIEPSAGLNVVLQPGSSRHCEWCSCSSWRGSR